MSDLKPWEAGYVTPPPSPVMSKTEIGRLGGVKQAERRKAGLPTLPVSDGTKPPGRPITNMERQAKYDSMTEETLPLKRKMFLDKFVFEYLHDFNAPMAYIRAGGSTSHANTGGASTLRIAYVQTQLRVVREMIDEEQLVTRAEVILGIKKEAHHSGDDGSSAARVRAWGLLAKIKGMEAPTKVDIVDERPKGGVMEVPMVATEVEWQEVASSSQTQLKTDVRT